MTGTASEMIDYNNEIPDKSNDLCSSRVIQLTAWIFGRIEADCLLSDITACGCSILLPKKHATPADIFKLIIMSPDNNDKVHSVLISQIRWEDAGFTQSHKKAGIRFLELTDDQHSEINILANLFCKPDHPLVKCSILIP